MSQSSSTQNAPTQRSRQNSDQSHETPLHHLTPQSALTPVRMISFWVAIALPFLYLPLLGFGFEAQSDIVAFVFLVAVNVVALVIGHNYNTWNGS